MNYNTRENSAIVQAQLQQLAVRHVWLVERGIHSLPILGITESRIKELCSNLWDFDFDKRARTLKTIADLGKHIRSCRRNLDSLIFPVVENIYHYYGPNVEIGYQYQMELFSHGLHYPPGTEYLDLLRNALYALVGFVNSPDEAIVDVLYFGTTASRIIAIDWLADNRLNTVTYDSFSDYLCVSLNSVSQKVPLLMALKYADAKINDHVDESMRFFADEIILINTPDDLKAMAREYLERLHERASQTTLIYAFRLLAGTGDSRDEECAIELFDEVMVRDLKKYSDNDLEMICCFKDWPSDERDEVDEYEELVMEELKRRGIYG